MAVLPPFSKIKIGDVLDERYLLQEVIGEGAYGTVYRAEHVYTKRLVSVKILRDDVMQDKGVVQRFIREARLASELDHRNCVRIYEFGKTHDGKFYLVMEFLEGETLGDRLDRVGRVTLLEAKEIVLQLLSALEAAHAKGIIHRDVKPDNLMLIQSKQGECVKLLDFGFAKRPVDLSIHMSEAITKTGFSLGTPEYMAPEQAVSKAIDPRTDLYSAGVIFYCLLTGRPPFEHENPLEVVLDQVKKEPPPPREIAPDAMIPELVEQVILRILSKNPKDRYPDAHSFAASIEAAITHPYDADKPTPKSFPQLVAVAKPRGFAFKIQNVFFPWLRQVSSYSARIFSPLLTRKFWQLREGEWKRPAVFGRLLVVLCIFFLFGTLLAWLFSDNAHVQTKVPSLSGEIPQKEETSSPASLQALLPEVKQSDTQPRERTDPETMSAPVEESLASLQKAKALLADANPREAMVVLGEYLQESPEDAEAWIALVSALSQLDRWQQAQKAFFRAKKLKKSVSIPKVSLRLALRRFEERNKTGRAAKRFLLNTSPELAAPFLGKELSNSRYQTRVTVASMLATIGKTPRYDPVPDMIVALQRESFCEKKKPFLQSLATFRKDKRVSAVLREEEKYIGFFGKNRCLSKLLPSLISKQK